MDPTFTPECSLSGESDNTGRSKSTMNHTNIFRVSTRPGLQGFISETMSPKYIYFLSADLEKDKNIRRFYSSVLSVLFSWNLVQILEGKLSKNISAAAVKSHTYWLVSMWSCTLTLQIRSRLPLKVSRLLCSQGEDSCLFFWCLFSQP